MASSIVAGTTASVSPNKLPGAAQALNQIKNAVESGGVATVVASNPNAAKKARKAAGVLTLNPAVEAALQNFKKHFAWVGTHFFERESELQAIQLGLLLQQHVVMQGIHGVAKSEVAATAMYNIRDEKVFEVQLTQFDGLEVLFGPVDIQTLKTQGFYQHNVTDCLPTARFAIIEEIYDANRPVLRSALQMLNERKFTRGRFRVDDCPLWTTVATTNFYDEDDEKLAALADRFLIRMQVQPIQQRNSRMQLYKLDRSKFPMLPADEQLDFADIKLLSNAVNQVVVSDFILETYDMVLQEINGKLGKPQRPWVTDRRARQVSRLLRAAAVLDGRMEVTLDDVETTRFGLIIAGRDNHEKTFDDIHDKLVEPRRKLADETRRVDNCTQLLPRLIQASSGADEETQVQLVIDFRRVLSTLEKTVKETTDSALKTRAEQLSRDGVKAFDAFNAQLPADIQKKASLKLKELQQQRANPNMQNTAK